MSNVKLSELLPDVLPQLNADPSEPVVEHAIKRAAIEFCELSRVWRHVPDPQSIIAGESFYDIEAPMGADVVGVLSVKADGVLLQAQTITQLDQLVPGWRSPGRVQYFAQLDTEQIMLAPAPDTAAENGLDMVLALRPSASSTTIPKWMMARYGQAIAHGALSRLYLMTGKPWADGSLGTLMRDRFMTGVAAAKSDGETGMGTAVIRTTSHY